MRLLLVENDVDMIDELCRALCSAVPELTVCVAASRDAALELIGGEDFDLVVCDLRIPSQDGALDEDVHHGLAVEQRMRQALPGVPVIILSAYLDVELLRSMAREGTDQADAFGSGPRQMLTFVPKTDLPEFLDEVSSVAEQLRILEDIEVVSEDVSPALSSYESRVLKIFARRKGGAIVRVSLLGGGLSGSRVLRVLLQDETSDNRALAVAKIADRERVDDERRRFQAHVAPLLPVGSFVPEMEFVQAGASRCAGLFYSLASGYEMSAFDVLRDKPDDGGGLAKAIAEMERPWVSASPTRWIRIGELRRKLCPDDVAEAAWGDLGRSDMAAFEGRKVLVHSACQHGDLHGLNVLVNGDLKPLLIDYGETGRGFPASFDPVTLELSPIFHPAGDSACGGWPTIDQALKWPDLTEYARDSPIEGFVRACRAWADEVKAGEREIYVSAYVYAIRQLRYDGPNKDLARAVVRAAIEALESS